MGQHTWFAKDKDQYLKILDLYEQLSNYEDDHYFLQKQIDEIYEENETDDYYDLFRTWKRDPMGYYIEEYLTKDTYLKWLEDNKDVVGYKQVYNDTPEREEELRVYAMQRLKEFFEEYPNGVIYFG